MNQPLRRQAKNERLLPPPSAELYAGPRSSTAHTAAWQTLLQAGKAQDLPAWRRLTGWCRDGRQRVQRLLHLHRRAFEAELQGHWQRADFFWQEAFTGLRRLWARQSDWDHAAAGYQLGFSGSGLREVLAGELFIDSHIAFANGRLAADGLGIGDRAFAHVRWVSRLLSLPHDPPLAEFDGTLKPALMIEVDLLQGAKRFDEALARLRDEPKAAELPELLDRLAMLLLRRTLHELAPDPAGWELVDAAKLARGIDEVEKLRARHPEHLLSYDVLAQLHHLRSIRLANGERLSEALVCSAKSAAHAAADFEEPAKVMAQLLENLNTLREQMRTIMEQIGRTPGQRLNDAGLKLKAEAERGLEPLQAFQASGEAERIVAARAQAALARAQRQPDAPAPAGAEPTDMPAIPAVPHARQDGLPPLAWLLGTQDVATRTLAACAAAGALGVVALATIEVPRRHVRAEALQQIRTVPAGDHEAIMAAAERFLQARTLDWSDPRSGEVREAYAKAFTEWFASLERTDTDLARERIARYRRLAIEGDPS